MSAESSSPTRRGFLGTSAAGAVAFAALQLATTSAADAQSSKPMNRGSSAFEPLEQQNPRSRNPLGNPGKRGAHCVALNRM